MQFKKHFLDRSLDVACFRSLGSSINILRKGLIYFLLIDGQELHFRSLEEAIEEAESSFLEIYSL